MLIAVWHQDGGQEDPSLGSRANPTSWGLKNWTLHLSYPSKDLSPIWPIFSPASSQEPSPPPRLPAAFLKKVCGARGASMYSSVQPHGLKSPFPTGGGAAKNGTEHSHSPIRQAKHLHLPGGMVAVQLTAPLSCGAWQGRHHQPQPCLEEEEGGQGPGGMQAVALGVPSALAVSVFAGVRSAGSWKHQLSQGLCRQHHEPALAVHILTEVCWRGQPVPWHGWLQPNNSTGLAPATTPFRALPRPSLPTRSSACSPSSSALFAFGSSCGKTRLNANTITAHTPKKTRSCG